MFVCVGSQTIAQMLLHMVMCCVVNFMGLLLLQVRDSKHPKKAMNDLGADGMSSY